jgi:ribosome-associated protein
MEKVRINTDTIKLDQFLKYCGAAATGSEAKYLIKDGNILVNGVEERRRGRKLSKGDVIRVGDDLEYAVE